MSTRAPLYIPTEIMTHICELAGMGVRAKENKKWRRRFSEGPLALLGRIQAQEKRRLSAESLCLSCLSRAVGLSSLSRAVRRRLYILDCHHD